MSEQMSEDWVEQEYDTWRKDVICDPLNTAESSQYVARAFAIYLLKKENK